jgi:hypothetical protein
LEQLVEAKVNKMPVPKDEIPQSTGKVINLMMNPIFFMESKSAVPVKKLQPFPGKPSTLTLLP